MNIKWRSSRGISLVATAIAMTLIFALASSAAQAAEWFAGTTPANEAKLATSEPFSAELGNHLFENGPYKGTSHKEVTLTLEHAGQRYEFVASGVRVEKEGTIFNKGGGATSSARIAFTSIKSVNLPSCTVQENQMKTNTLQTQLFISGGKTYERFSPANETSTFAPLTIIGELCPISGVYLVKGNLITEATDLGSSAKSHSLNIPGPQIQMSQNASLTIGTNMSVGLEGTLIEALTSGKYWSTK